MRAVVEIRTQEATLMTEQVLSHRLRLLLGMAKALGEKEYAAVTVSDVVAAAGVSKRTFYEHFSSKQECLLACYGQANALLMDGIRRAGPAPDGATPDADKRGTDRVERVLNAYLSMLDESRAIAAALLIEITSAGAEGRRVRREGNLEMAKALLEVVGRESGDERFDLPQAIALVGGVTELVLLHAESRPDQPFTELRPAVLKFVQALLR